MDQNTLPITLENDEHSSNPEKPSTEAELNSSDLHGKERSKRRHILRSENADNTAIFFGA